MQIIASIQYLRAIAALAVVLHHISFQSGRWFDSGAGGVDLFFVISGFIMWTVTDEKETRPSQFLWRRIIRIVPLYWLVTLVTFAIAAVVPAYFYGFLAADPAMLAASLAFVPAADPVRQAVVPIVPMGWTLNVEMFFYVLMAGALFLPRRLQLPFLGLSLCGLAAAGVVMGDATPWHAIHCNIRLLEFLAGLVLGKLWLAGRIPSGPLSAGILASGVLGFVGLAALMDSGALQPFFGKREIPVIIWGLPSVAVVAGALGIERAGWTPKLPALLMLGNASYALYLTHDLVIHLTMRGPLPEPVRIGLSLAVAAAVALATHAFVEKPIGAFLRRQTDAINRRRAARRDLTRAALFRSP